MAYRSRNAGRFQTKIAIGSRARWKIKQYYPTCYLAEPSKVESMHDRSRDFSIVPRHGDYRYRSFHSEKPATASIKRSPIRFDVSRTDRVAIYLLARTKRERGREACIRVTQCAPVPFPSRFFLPFIRRKSCRIIAVARKMLITRRVRSRDKSRASRVGTRALP